MTIPNAERLRELRRVLNSSFHLSDREARDLLALLDSHLAGAECSQRVAQQIVRVRAALIVDDNAEASHQLYAIASPNFDKLEPWAELETLAGFTTDSLLDEALARKKAEPTPPPAADTCKRCFGFKRITDTAEPRRTMPCPDCAPAQPASQAREDLANAVVLLTEYRNNRESMLEIDREWPETKATLRRQIHLLNAAISALSARETSAEVEPNYNDEFFALRNAMRDWPKLPPGYVLKWLRGTFPDDWQRGKAMQRELGRQAIPYKTECEIGAGMWDRITNGAWREAAAGAP